MYYVFSLIFLLLCFFFFIFECTEFSIHGKELVGVESKKKIDSENKETRDHTHAQNMGRKFLYNVWMTTVMKQRPIPCDLQLINCHWVNQLRKSKRWTILTSSNTIRILFLMFSYFRHVCSFFIDVFYWAVFSRCLTFDRSLIHSRSKMGSWMNLICYFFVCLFVWLTFHVRKFDGIFSSHSLQMVIDFYHYWCDSWIIFIIYFIMCVCVFRLSHRKIQNRILHSKWQ